MNNVVFVHPGDEDMASYRYRTKMPAEHLSKTHTVSINEGLADVIVFSKPVPNNLDLAKQCKKDGTKIIVDICDDHFSHPTLGPVYKDMVDISDTVICPTNYFKDMILQRTGKSAEVIEDPFEYKRKEPHANGDRVLWFGHQRNIHEIVPYIGNIENLSVCTGNNKTLIGYIPWTQQAEEQELAYNNIVILPNKNEKKSVNRLINAVMSGCFVCAEKTEARKEFRKLLWIGNIHTGLKWCKAFQNELNDRVAEAQDYIEKNYSLDVIGKKWEQVI
jgi:hypothetical protein